MSDAANIAPNKQLKATQDEYEEKYGKSADAESAGKTHVENEGHGKTGDEGKRLSKLEALESPQTRVLMEIAG